MSEAIREILEASAVPVISEQVGQRDVVRVMNLHKAKGLEARVVFLAAPTNGLPSNANHALQGGHQGALCLYRNRKPLAHPVNWEELEAREMTFLAAERLRLLYVAATRAKETLVVGRWSGSHGSALRPWIELEWGIHALPITDSILCRSVIPIYADHAFQRLPIAEDKAPSAGGAENAVLWCKGQYAKNQGSLETEVHGAAPLSS